jgi:transcriptional regulator with GAF, ATPase, and Fis domain
MASAVSSPEPFIVGHSARMRAVVDFVCVLGRSDSTVLITGESGTGKEVTARLIHESSLRRHKPLVAVSCALFSETLIESELFGHERGAFTGAIKDRPGRFEMAEGGTIFLDDIDDVPLSMQVKLLRVIQNRTIERLGGTRTIPVNVRILAGTKRDLMQLVAEGKFREDLFYRLNVLPIALPPLRERREDVPVLMEHFLERFFRRRGEDPPAVSPGVRDAFMRYDWPGNVRELENVCEQLAQVSTCGVVRASCLPAALLFAAGKRPAVVVAAEETSGITEARVAGMAPVSPQTSAPPKEAGELAAPMPSEDQPISLDERVREFEASLIKWALTTSRGNKSKAARLLGVKRSTLGDRIQRAGLSAKGEAWR